MYTESADRRREEEREEAEGNVGCLACLDHMDADCKKFEELRVVFGSKRWMNVMCSVVFFERELLPKLDSTNPFF